MSVARVELGVTLYLSDMAHWAQRGASQALDVFLDAASDDRPLWFTTSLLSSWRRWTESRKTDAREALRLPWTRGEPRHLFRFDLWDDPSCPSMGVSYFEVDARREARSGVLEITLPQETDPRALLDLVQKLAPCGRFFSGVAGYAVRWNPNFRGLAFSRIWEWCRRYLGLDIQDWESFSWSATEGLSSSNWLTVLNQEMGEKLQLEAIHSQGQVGKVALRRIENGWMVQAGPEASLGDRNLLALPKAYFDAASMLAPLFVPLDPFPGKFEDELGTEHWSKRLVEPMGWA